MSIDLFKLSREISKELGELGWENFSEEVENTIRGGSTGTEILMGLNWIFSKFLKSKGADLPKEIKDKISNLVNKINIAL